MWVGRNVDKTARVDTMEAGPAVVKFFPSRSGGAYTISILQEITAVHDQFHDTVDGIKCISSGKI